jgi:hypothetical protein
MSNRWSAEELQRIERFFSRLEPGLSTFARSRALTVNRRYHAWPTWDLLFRHPGGGTGKLEIERVDDETGYLSLCWWKDAYEDGIRFLRTERWSAEPMPTREIVATLDEALRRVLGWGPTDLQERHGFKDTWQSIPRDVFESEERRYSLPVFS